MCAAVRWCPNVCMYQLYHIPSQGAIESDNQKCVLEREGGVSTPF